MQKTLLIIDDKADVRLSARFLLANYGYDILEADSPLSGLTQLHENHVDLVLLDMNFAFDTTSGEEGLFFLRKLTDLPMKPAVVAMTAWANTELVVKALHNGAHDFIEKPWDNARLVQVIENALKLCGLDHENTALKQTLADNVPDIDLICHSSAMQHLKQQLDQVAHSKANILFTGENGTGKSTLANYVHQSSNMAGEFVEVNMAAVPESLFESEMFGHTKGAFTGADKARIGRFELAKNGTLFLDEIAETPLTQQAKLLRVLESGHFERVGSSQTQYAKPRMISATNADMASLIEQKYFRQDLFYRVNTITIEVPSLAQRHADIPALAEQFLQRHQLAHHKKGLSFSACALAELQRFKYPGNLRELSHIVERLVLMTVKSHITRDEVVNLLNHSVQQTQFHQGTLPLMTFAQAERMLLKHALESTSGQTLEAAELLGISKSAIYRRLEKYDISAKDFV
ncbi:sigma-54-dependent Fis family transcriptional regulator [Pseudoalteromonas citrea]|uniref:Sigma-54-dependent Fis family transcriptional regulator n=1 Tax=Pseudoalteromonas citrea TaxID=43655 RepID=A0A5S3XTB9_9GAMM|nr:sigma-54 dependent transcriptional regulator [Pseudoalteromonas citrea]TMP44713.1 sigma-54-dependent Fis family transcriptional regulator [Pseudoalteromonas citrea]TMP61087.1 sigma-54-dependent Fis family transcriptional regulator [Pseudoalteromonas citrea]